MNFRRSLVRLRLRPSEHARGRARLSRIRIPSLQAARLGGLASLVGRHRSRPRETELYLIYPRDEKFAQSFEQPFLEMMSRFQMALREKDTALLLIGFGFNDHHLNQPIYHALATNPNFKLLVVDYSPEAKLASGQAWDTLYRLQNSGAPLDVIQMDFQEFPSLLPTYSQARASNTQERAAQLLKVLSAKA